jgi:hypothetical protein
MSDDSEAIKRSLELVKEIESQTDRGAAIVGAAWLEEELSAAIQSFLHHDPKASQRLFGRSGAISTFSAKIDLARVLGMCTAAIASDLHIIREVRNEFAHSVLSKENNALSFGTPSLKDRCLGLQCISHEAITEPRHAFIRACAVLNADFYMHRFFGQKVQDGGQVFAKGKRDV